MATGSLGLVQRPHSCDRGQEFGLLKGMCLPPAIIQAPRDISNRLSDVIDSFQARYAAERVKRPEVYRWQFDKYVIPHLATTTSP